MLNKSSGTRNRNSMLKSLQQNNKALALALQAEKERVRRATAVILQLKREQQALSFQLILLQRKLKEQVALVDSASEKTTRRILLTEDDEDLSRRSQRVDDRTVPEAPPFCTGDGRIQDPEATRTGSRKTESSPSSPSTESEDSLYVSEKTKERRSSPERTNAITIGTFVQRYSGKENIPPKQDISGQPLVPNPAHPLHLLNQRAAFMSHRRPRNLAVGGIALRH